MDTYKLKLAQGDYSLEAEGDKEFVLEVAAKYFGTPGKVVHPAVQSPPAPSSPPELPGSGKSTSVGEFILKLGVKKHTDYVIAFGYYLEKYQGLTDFTPADINNCYYDAKMESSNTSQMIILNIKRGYLMEARGDGAKGKKRYTLTSSGLSYIDALLLNPLL